MDLGYDVAWKHIENLVSRACMIQKVVLVSCYTTLLRAPIIKETVRIITIFPRSKRMTLGGTRNRRRACPWLYDYLRPRQLHEPDRSYLIKPRGSGRLEVRQTLT